MTTLVDTSALLAVMDADDANHRRAKRKWIELLEKDVPLICSNYILLEMFAILHNRFAIKAVMAFQNDIVPILQIYWIDEFLHRTAMAAMLAAGRRRLSLVDCVSFELMRQLGLDNAFVFDSDFASQGFHCIP